jgi:hypothetical protein
MSTICCFQLSGTGFNKSVWSEELKEGYFITGWRTEEQSMGRFWGEIYLFPMASFLAVENMEHGVAAGVVPGLVPKGRFVCFC